MKATASISALLLAAASTVTAQNYNQTAGFTLTLSGSSDPTVNGQVLGACHSGAAIEGLCLSGTAATGSYNTFYLNYTQYNDVDGQPTGPLVWNLQANSENGIITESEPLTFLYQPGSNVAVPLFYPDEPNVFLGFDSSNNMFVVSSYDDSTFTSTSYPIVTGPTALYQWFACYTYVEGYYYHSLAWVTAGPPHNPTCEAVTVTRTFV